MCGLESSFGGFFGLPMWLNMNLKDGVQMKISAKTKDCSLLVKVKTTGRERIDEKEFDRFARVYLRCFLKPKQVKSGGAELAGPIGIPLKDRLQKEITKRDFLFVIEYIVVAMQKLRNHNFPVCYLNMDMQNIFINETTKELQFLYVPMVSVQESGSIVDLLNSIIYLARPAAEKDTDYISRFNYFVKSIRPFNIDVVEQFVQHEDRSVVNTVRKHNAGQSGFMTSDHKHYYDRVDAQKKMQEEEERRQAVQAVQVGVPQRPVVDEDATSLLTQTDVNYPSGVGVASGIGVAQATPTNVGFAGVAESSEEATGLLTNFEETAGNGSVTREPVDYFAGLGETASPSTGFVQTADPSEEATGLLTNPNETAGSGPVTREPVDYFAGLGETASPSTGFVRQEGHFAGAEEATGLLVEPFDVPNYFENVSPVGGYEEEATTLLTETGHKAGAEIRGSQVTPIVVYPELQRKQTGETIRVNKPVFRIGKERSYVDYFVTNNSAVSRSHADIITRGSKYFVVDLNSKNGTYINNRAIAAQTEVAIKDGDLLRLANEEFVFCVAGMQTAADPNHCPRCNAPVNPGSNFCGACGQKVRG